jgi:hypothetical protein
MKSLLLLVQAVVLALAGCSDRPEVVTDTAAPAGTGAVELTPELRERVVQRGRAIASETFSLLSSNLQAAIASGGVTNALPYCSLAASPLTASIADRHGVTLRRVADRARNPKGKADATESAILQGYRFAIAQTNALQPVVTNLLEHSVTFFAPIVLTNALCLKCHGRPGEDIPTEGLEVIRRLYPQDEAVGFRMGELRGAWRIDFPIRTLGSTADQM